MSQLFARYRSVVLVSLLAAGTSACRDGTGPQRLSPQEVGAVYHICALGFEPNQTLLPTVDIRTVAMDTSAQATAPSRLYVDNVSTEFELEYSAPGSTARRRHAGTYQTGTRTVLLNFANPAPLLTGLLMPGSIEMDFEANPNRLQFTRTGHDVPRQEYTQLAGISEDGLAPQIRGTLSGHFQAGGCS